MKIGILLRNIQKMKNGNIYKIKFSKQILKDKEKLKNANLDKTTQNILNLMLENPFCYPPSYEKLVGELSGLYSKRINRHHRIVYEVNESKKEIRILRMWTHYDKM